MGHTSLIESLALGEPANFELAFGTSYYLTFPRQFVSLATTDQNATLIGCLVDQDVAALAEA